MINNRKFTINYIIISFFIVLISIISFSLLNSNVNAVNLQLTGSGTASNPYKIYTCDDFINFVLIMAPLQQPLLIPKIILLQVEL